MDANLSEEVCAKLIDPDLEDVYSTDFGANFKANEADMNGGKFW